MLRPRGSELPPPLFESGMGERHSRHELFPGIGKDGQNRLYDARVAIIGCGAVGSHVAELLTRAGVGRRGLIRIVDRDTVDESNLQRQAVFTEEDARLHRPKAVAAVSHLREIDSAVKLDSVVRDFNPSNAARFVQDVDLILDGTDNFRTRFVINDAAILAKKPWIYAGAVGSKGIVGLIIPGQTPCLRCYLERQPPLGSYDSCDTAGIITPLPSFVAALEVSLALRLLTGNTDLPRGLATVDLWTDLFSRQMEHAEREPSCASCGTLELPALQENEQVAVLCGRNSVQIFSDAGATLSSAAAKMALTGRNVRRHPESLTAEIDEGLLTLFDDGRVIVEGTTDPMRARSIVARYLGG